MPPEPSHAESPAAAGDVPAGSAVPTIATIPEGYVAVPVSPDSPSAPLQVCALVRLAPDPVAGRLVLLRDAADARVYLGAIVDAGGLVHEWVELWAQDLDGINATASSVREALSNATLDERWRQWARFLASPAAGDRRLIVQTGWESQHPPPVWLDPARREAVPLTDPASGQRWRLCRDDAALAAAQLPAYTTSLHRYLHLPGQGADGKFVPVTSGAPEGPRTTPLEAVLPGATGGRDPAGLVPFNRGGGLLLVRRHGGIGLEAFLDLLSGADDAPGATAPTLAASALAAGPGRSARPREAWLCIGEPARGARLLEAFHLKLRVLADAVAAVRSLVEQARRPVLNLEPERFRVRLGEPGAALPVLWTAATHLVDPGEAVELPPLDPALDPAAAGGAAGAAAGAVSGAVAGAKEWKTYLPARPLGASVYRPVPPRPPAQGPAVLRIDRVLDEPDGSAVVEGALQTQERFQGSAGDLVRLRVCVGDGRGERIDLYARFDGFKAQPGATPPQWQFRTLRRPLGTAARSGLRPAEGATLSDASFEVVPLWSTPADLYALGVMAVRTLLVDNRTTLPAALEELTGLARQVADEHDDSAPLRLRVRSAFESDPAWMTALGPQRLTWDELKPEQVFDLLPPELWWDVLAMLVRMLPGVGPDSTCKSFADVPADGLHRVFDDVAGDLNRLLVRTRSLIVVDWRSNREMNAVIRTYLPAADPAAAPGPPPLPGGASGAGAPGAARARPTRAGDAKAR